MTFFRFFLEVNNLQRVQGHIEAIDSLELDRRHPEGAFGYKGSIKKKIETLAQAARFHPSEENAIKPSQIKDLGSMLFNILFQDDLLTTFWEYYEKVARENQELLGSSVLRIELQIDEKVEGLAAVAALPWEFMHAEHPQKGNFWLAEEPNLRFLRVRSRHFPLQKISLQSNEPLKVALVVADFVQKRHQITDNLGIPEYKVVLKELRKVTKQSSGLITLIEPIVQQANRGNIDLLLEKYQPHIFHFIGHGRFLDPGKDFSGQVALVDDAGYPEWVSGEDFGNLLNRSRPAVVLMQTCEGGANYSSKAFAGIASQILDQGIQAVVAMQYEVQNITATTFVREFYSRLCVGVSVDKAVQEGRRKLATTVGSHTTRDFATPVLFTNDGGQNLFVRNEAPEPELIIWETDQNNKKYRDWGLMPDVSVFFGREGELKILGDWIVKDKCRLVAILGMRGVGKTKLSIKLGKGGIGKTDLSLKLVKGIQDDFEYVVWRSLLNAPKLENLLIDIIKFLSNQKEVVLPDNIDDKIDHLIFYLTEHRCLLMLDNFETVLAGGEDTGKYREGYEEYGKLLLRISEGSLNSCLIITSREKPNEIAMKEGKTLPVRSFELGGVNHLDAKNIFSEIGSYVGTDNQWIQLNTFYGGNPLALELAARYISEVYFGNISEFLIGGLEVFNDLQDLLNWHFARLSSLQVELLYWLAINRESISLNELKDDLLSSASKELASSTILALQRRIPLDKADNRFTLQPMLIEHVTNNFINRICYEIEYGKLDLFNTHLLLKASGKNYVREAQKRFILSPIINKLETLLFDSQNIESRLLEIISLLQEECGTRPGYSAGNSINLLTHLKGKNISNYDFSNLSIWQAYLQDVELFNVNFSNSHFKKCVFCDTFGITPSIAFSPNGEIIAAGTGNGEIRLWKAEDGSPLITCQGHTAWVRSIAFSPDGNFIVSGSYDKTIKLWDVKTGFCIKSWVGHDSEVYSVAFNPNGKIVASGGGDHVIRLWELTSGRCVNILKGHENSVSAINFSPDGKALASASNDGKICLWDVNSGEVLFTLEGHSRSVLSIAFSPDGKRIISAGRDQTIRLWEIETRSVIRSFHGHTNGIWSAIFSPDGRIVASGSYDQTVRIWDVETGYCIHTLQGHKSWIWSVAFSPDGKILASGGHDQTILLWEVKTGYLLRSMQGYSNAIYSVSFSPDGKSIAAANERGPLSIWDTSTGIRLISLQGHKNRAGSTCFNFEGFYLVSGSTDQTVRIWNAKTGKCVHVMQGHTNPVWSVSFSPDGKTVASGSGDHTVRIWDVATGYCLHVLKGHSNGVWAVAYSPDSQYILSGSHDETACLWEISTEKCLKVLKGHSKRIYSVAYSSDGFHMATGSADKTICIWLINNDEYIYRLEGHSGEIYSIAFSSDGSVIASAGEDGIIMVWDVVTGQLIKSLTGHKKAIWSLTFNLRGDILGSASDDETIKLWNVRTGECLRSIKNIKPYEGVVISHSKGLPEYQKASLRMLGAIEE